MKVLTFDNEVGKENYKILYEGLSMTQKQFDKKEVRRLDKVFTLIESIGQPTEETKDKSLQFFELKTTPCSVEMEDADFEILKSAIEPPNVAWNGVGSRRAGKLLIWLDAVPDKTPEPPKLME